jgi:hypothetical protein
MQHTDSLDRWHWASGSTGVASGSHQLASLAVLAPRHYALCSAPGSHRLGAPRGLSPCQESSPAQSCVLEAPRPVQRLFLPYPQRRFVRAQDRCCVTRDA